MRNLKTLNNWLYEYKINEAEVKDLDMEDMNPGMAKTLLGLANKEYEGEFQGSYTVSKGSKTLRFDTYAALLVSVQVADDGGNYGPPYGIVLTDAEELEDFENNVVGKLNTKSLSAAIASVKKAMKAAEKEHNKLGSLAAESTKKKK